MVPDILEVKQDVDNMNSSTTRGRKRSKWDQTPSEVVKPSEAAAEAAARLNAKLAAEGKLVLSNPPQLPVRVMCSVCTCL